MEAYSESFTHHPLLENQDDHSPKQNQKFNRPNRSIEYIGTPTLTISTHFHEQMKNPYAKHKTWKIKQIKIRLLPAICNSNQHVLEGKQPWIHIHNKTMTQTPMMYQHWNDSSEEKSYDDTYITDTGCVYSYHKPGFRHFEINHQRCHFSRTILQWNLNWHEVNVMEHGKVNFVVTEKSSRTNRHLFPR